MKVENKKQLVILTPGFPTDESDSTCLPAQQSFILAVKKKYPSIRISVITFHYPYRQDVYVWNGIAVYSLNGRNRSGLTRLVTWTRAWRALRSLKKNGQLIGILSFWCTEYALIGKWFGRWNGLKHYSWILGQDARSNNGFVKWIKPKTTELIALSHFLQQEFERNHHIRPAYVIPNAVDPGTFPPLEAARSIDVIGVGSLIPLKQYNVFISVLKKAVAQFPSLAAIICGKGSEQEALQQLINDAGLKKNLVLVGEKPHHEVLLLLQQSRVLLHPSSYEGYSSVCLEALYAGTQVISFQKPDEKMVEQWHVAKSTEEMEEILLELLKDNNHDHKRVLLYTAEESAEAVMELFGIDKAAD